MRHIWSGFRGSGIMQVMEVLLRSCEVELTLNNVSSDSIMLVNGEFVSPFLPLGTLVRINSREDI